MSAAPEPPATPAAPMDNRPWVEKYRPVSFDEVVAHGDILDTLKRFIETSNLPHLLFYGPPGTGKTSTVQALCRTLYGNRVKGNVLELNASDDRGIDVVRNEIKDFASTGQVFSFAPPASTTSGTGSSGSSGPPAPAIKLVVLDEADQMSHEAQAALRRIVEKYTKNVRFAILCNHVNKIIPALQSRCTRFRFGPVKRDKIMGRLSMIATKEHVSFTENGLTAAFKISNGDMRRCLNIMHAAALSMGEITESSVYTTTGNPLPAEVQQIILTMVNDDFPVAWSNMETMIRTTGMSCVDLARELHPWVIRLDFPEDCKLLLLIRLAEVEYYLSAGMSEQTAFAAVLGAFQIVRECVSLKKSARPYIAAPGAEAAIA